MIYVIKVNDKCKVRNITHVREMEIWTKPKLTALKSRNSSCASVFNAINILTAWSRALSLAFKQLEHERGNVRYGFHGDIIS